MKVYVVYDEGQEQINCVHSTYDGALNCQCDACRFSKEHGYPNKLIIEEHEIKE